MAHYHDQVTVEGQISYASLHQGLSTQATAASTLTLSNTSKCIQTFTGTTAGQIVKMGDATTYSVGHTYLFHNLSNQRISVTNNANGALLTLYANYRTTLILQDNSTAAGVWLYGLSTSTDSFWVFENGLLTWSDQTGADLNIQQFGGSGSAYVRQTSANGTIASPLPVTNGQRLGGYGYYGWNSSGVNGMPSAEDLITASEDHTPTAWGGDRTWNTIKNGTTTSVEWMRLYNDGRLRLLSSIEDLAHINTLTSTASTLNGDLVLTVASGTLHEITGTQTGYTVTLPNATTLTKGMNYKFVNSSTQNIDIDYNGGALVLRMPPNSKMNMVLLTNATAAELGLLMTI
jgi:hypothetical protein